MTLISRRLVSIDHKSTLMPCPMIFARELVILYPEKLYQPWQSAVEFRRYLVRFTHMLAGFNTLSGIMRTVHNQYDSIVRPLQKWLNERGVRFQLNTRVTDLDFRRDSDGYTVERVVSDHNGHPEEIKLDAKDKVIVTLGSMTEASSTARWIRRRSLESLTKPPPPRGDSCLGITKWFRQRSSSVSAENFTLHAPPLIAGPFLAYISRCHHWVFW